MNKFFKRIGAILLALTLCFGTTITAFAAEDEKEMISCTISNNEKLSPQAIGNSLYYTYTDELTPSYVLSITTQSGNWDADFSALIYGNSEAHYRVTLNAPNGYSDQVTLYGNGHKAYFRTMTYAQAGTYTFHFQQISGPIGKLHAEIEIYD